MKIRQAKKILNMMERGTDTRYFDSKYTFKKESRFIPRLKNLYQKATIRFKFRKPLIRLQRLSIQSSGAD